MRASRSSTRSLVAVAATLFTGAILGVFAFTAGAEPIRLSEPVAATSTYEVFGAPIALSRDAPRLSQLLAKAGAGETGPIQVRTRIAKVCQKKGCFFIARDGEAVARVTFADYGFFIPTDAGGKEVTLVGTLSRESVSPGDAEHFARDLGEAPAAMTDPFEYRIVATSVMIPRS